MISLPGLAWTLILFLPAPHGLYVAADSRFDGGADGRKDEARKIFLCGKRAVCAISGALILNAKTQDAEGAVREGSFDLAGLVEKLSAELPETNAEEQIGWLASRIHAGLAPFWRDHIGGRPLGRPMSASLGAPSVCTLLFAKREVTGETALVQVQFPFREIRSPEGWFHELQSPVVRPADPQRPLAQGATTCPKIDPTEPPLVETREQTAATLKQMFLRTRDGGYCESVIGGPVDIAVADEQGAAWIARKDQSPASASPPVSK